MDMFHPLWRPDGGHAKARLRLRLDGTSVRRRQAFLTNYPGIELGEGENNSYCLHGLLIVSGIPLFCECQQWEKYLFGQVRDVSWRKWQRHRAIGE